MYVEGVRAGLEEHARRFSLVVYDGGVDWTTRAVKVSSCLVPEIILIIVPEIVVVVRNWFHFMQGTTG